MPITLRPHQQRALDAMQDNLCGQIIVPTGGGKTFIMVQDALRRMQNATKPMVITVIAPRILLANQLCDDFFQGLNGNVECVFGHVHSGETHFWSSTKPAKISQFVKLKDTNNVHIVLFTTYNSLRRLNEIGLKVDVAYFDEAHNSVRRDFFDEVAGLDAQNYYYFTATPRHSRKAWGRGMNNNMVYGEVIMNVPAPELVNNGSILPPTVVPYEIDIERQKGNNAAESDRHMLLNVIDDLDADQGQKVLVAAPSSKVMWGLLTKTPILHEMRSRGYDVLHITSKYGAYINDKKVNREVFFDTFNAWGKDPNRKFVIFHYSILSEGINVHGLTHTILLRNLQIVEMAQTIGRVIRLNKDDTADIQSGKIEAGNFAMYRKPTGFVTVPVFKNYGVHTIKRLQMIVDTIFVKGLPAISTNND
jgi:superfamily II DNA or RNA helicase